jgi:hypothetical protein
VVRTEHFSGALTGIDQFELMQLLNHVFVYIETIFLENDLRIGLKAESLDTTQDMAFTARVNTRDIGIFDTNQPCALMCFSFTITGNGCDE